MDISVASNFERLLYDFYLDRNSKVCSDIYSNFPKTAININVDVWQKSEELFLIKLLLSFLCLINQLQI